MRPRRTTRYIRCAHCALTDATSQITKRAKARGHEPCAARRRIGALPVARLRLCLGVIAVLGAVPTQSSSRTTNQAIHWRLPWAHDICTASRQAASLHRILVLDETPTPTPPRQSASGLEPDCLVQVREHCAVLSGKSAPYNTLGLAEMPFFLLRLTDSELQELAASQRPPHFNERAEVDALPPAFVAARSLRLRAEGHPLPWSASFLIVSDVDQRIVGACGFKSAPTDGRVEVGYGVAAAARGQGAATKALNLLVIKAFEAGAKTVLAEVAPDNHASTKVVQKSGFVQTGARHDTSGEYVIQWLRSREA